MLQVVPKFTELSKTLCRGSVLIFDGTAPKDQDCLIVRKTRVLLLSCCLIDFFPSKSAANE